MIPPWSVFFQRQNQAIYIPVVASLIGTFIFLAFNQSPTLSAILSNRWSVLYFVMTPFLHGGFLHFLFNNLALDLIGRQLLLPVVGARKLTVVFILSMAVATAVNNMTTTVPAIGISAGVLGLLGLALYRFGHLPMRFLFFHTLLRLPPFPLYGVAGFIIAIDITGIIFDWQFFAHYAHLAGFACGAIGGFFIFRRF